MRFLSESAIVSIYRLRFSGLSIRAIEKQTGHGKETIIAHLSGRYEYSAKLRECLRKYKTTTPTRPREIPDDWLTLKQASWLIPFSPSVESLYDRIAEGSFRTTKLSGTHVTKHEWVEEYVKTQFGEIPCGVAILQRDLDMCLLDEPDKSFTAQLPSFELKGRSASRLFDVNRACVENGLRFEVPGIVNSRVARSLSFGAKSVVIHSGMFI